MPSIVQAVLLAVPTAAVTGTATVDDAGLLAQQARAVLAARCYGCHSAQEGKKKGGLTLDSRDAHGDNREDEWWPQRP